MKNTFLSSILILFAVTCLGQQQKEPPKASITDPLNGSFVYGGQIKITYLISASAPKSVKISVDGKNVQLITDAKLGENTATVEIPDKNCSITLSHKTNTAQAFPLPSI